MSKKIFSLDSRTWVGKQQDEKAVGNGNLCGTPSVRVPVVFCVDTGRGMFREQADGQTKMEKVLSFIKSVTSSFESDALRDSVDFSVVTFSDEVSCDRYFDCQASRPYEPDFMDKACSSIGTGVRLAADLIRDRLAEYGQAEIGYKDPVLFIFFGSRADRDDPVIGEAEELVAELVDSAGLRVFPVNVGEDADLETLGRFSSEETFGRYGDVDPGDFFSLMADEAIEEDETDDDDDDDDDSGVYGL